MCDSIQKVTDYMCELPEKHKGVHRYRWVKVEPRIVDGMDTNINLYYDTWW
jgi:hypothetical protein